jgi:PadR family transcriptional regulator PadR
MTPKTDLLQGTLDLLILQSIQNEPMHGWGISQMIKERSARAFEVNQGSLYPALHRLESRGSIAAEWGRSENNRRAKFYRLTRTGVKQLKQELTGWRTFAQAMDLVIGSAV